MKVEIGFHTIIIFFLLDNTYFRLMKNFLFEFLELTDHCASSKGGKELGLKIIMLNSTKKRSAKISSLLLSVHNRIVLVPAFTDQHSYSIRNLKIVKKNSPICF